MKISYFRLKKIAIITQEVEALVVPLVHTGDHSCEPGLSDLIAPKISGFDLRETQSMLRFSAVPNRTTACTAKNNDSFARIGNLVIGDLIFAVDSVRVPLQEVVTAILNQAHTQGYKSVGIPILRSHLCGRNLFVEPSLKEVLSVIKSGIVSFMSTHPDSDLKQIILFSENNSRELSALTRELFYDFAKE